MGRLISFYATSQRLTPELTGQVTTNQAFSLANEKQADSAPVE